MVIVKYTIFLSCLCLLLIGVKTQGQCELSGFTLTDLAKPAWWKLPLTNVSGCVFASTNGVFEHADCDFYFSICHGLRELPECNTDGNWSVCEKGTFNDQAQSSNVANYKPINESGSELTQPGQSGFQVLYTVEAAVNDLCQNISMNLTFLCDKQVTWPSTAAAGDVPSGADTYSFIYEFTEKICKYTLTFKYDGACYSAPTIGPTVCHISNYDYQMLAEHSYWEFDQNDNTVCKKSDSCNIFFAICNDLPQDISENCGTNSGVCIHSQGTYYNLGIYNNSYDDLVERPDKQGFIAEYKEGDGIFLGCAGGAKLTTTLNFKCEYQSTWPKDNTSHVALKPYNVDYDADKCTAVFYFNFYGACFTPTNNNTFDVPVLFIFVIFLFAIFAIYWVAGFIINLLLGKRGTEIIPNKSFWLQLIMLFGGGFMFLFNLITCKLGGKQVERSEDEEPIVKKGYQTIDNAKYPFGP